MRSATEDRTARAIIRDEALRLFAMEGPERVTIRQVAAAAGSSPALVVHHFGSKKGLRDAVDRYVLQMVESLLDQLTSRVTAELFDQGQEGARSLTEAMIGLQPPESALPAYLRRVLVTDTEIGKQIFARLYRMATDTLSSLVRSGAATPGDDPAVRAAVLMANDLAVLLLRDRLTESLGFDPLSQPGMARWAVEVIAIYGGGLRSGSPVGKKPRSPRSRSRLAASPPSDKRPASQKAPASSARRGTGTTGSPARSA